jgi:hypothetical protein
MKHIGLQFRLSKPPRAGPEDLGPRAEGQMASEGPQDVVKNTYKFIKYTPNIFELQIYLLNKFL